MALRTRLATLLHHTFSMEPLIAPSASCCRMLLPSSSVAAATAATLFGVRRTMSGSSRIFIGGLSWGTNEETLKEAFSSFGPVTQARIIVDRETGRSRGFGFVSFSAEQDAEAAVQGMDGQDLAGRTLHVTYATERAPGVGTRGVPGGGMSRGYGGGFGAAGRGDQGPS